MLLSIIVPAYNVGDYIARCVESCIDRAHEDSYEIIVVNDGSTDCTEKVISGYSAVKNLVVVTKQNGGLSSARNAGLNIARGKYVFFLDGDDFLADGGVGVLIENCAADYDLIAFDYFKVGDGGTEAGHCGRVAYGDISGTDSIVALLFTDDSNSSNWSAWGKLYKKSVLDGNALRFDESNYGSEDLDFNIRLLPYLNSVLSCSDGVVNYRINNSSSISKNVKPQTVLSLLKTLQVCVDVLNECAMKKSTKTVVFDNLSMWYLYCVKRYDVLDKDAKKQFKAYGRLKDILARSSKPKIKLCRIALSVLGVRLTNILLRRLRNKA